MPLATFLNGSVPTQLRGIAFLALSDVGQLGAGTVISDGGGGGTTAWAYSGTIPCRVDPLSAGGGRVTGGQLDERSTHTITVPPVPPGVTISASDRFSVTGSGTFEITATHVRTGAETQVFEVIQIS